MAKKQKSILYNRFFLYAIMFIAGLGVMASVVAINTSYSYLTIPGCIVFAAIFLYFMHRVVERRYNYP